METGKFSVLWIVLDFKVFSVNDLDLLWVNSLIKCIFQHDPKHFHIFFNFTVLIFVFRVSALANQANKWWRFLLMCCRICVTVKAAIYCGCSQQLYWYCLLPWKLPCSLHCMVLQHEWIELNGIRVWALLGRMHLGLKTGPLCPMLCAKLEDPCSFTKVLDGPYT